MRAMARIGAAEILKQHRRMSGSNLVFFSMLLWPLLQLLTTYYTVRPVVGGAAGSNWSAAADPQQLLAFLATGALGFSFFFALVQSAWHFSFERQTGTLELLFLSPVPRLVMVVANGFGALLQNAWLFLCFSLTLFLVTDVVRPAHPAMFLVAFLALLLPAVAWGAFLNSLLIFSRDSAFLFTIFDDPMAFASGARIPVTALPGGIAAIGTVLPLTGSLRVVRGALLEGKDVGDLAGTLASLAAVTVALLLLASLMLRLGERRAQRTGQLRLF
ncbi:MULTISPECIES: ABC transporter permease [unclassified Streptomyces]|uniref:ABC transporter permease n=1 Tax=unclassified Streptomyces TaxID=2593676 RepID=UPI002258FE6A|nr:MULTISPECIES: ABC transporter permease [unclassified Streptomyces]MCX4526998.1 ABC transporter permease [Streptomyces sp. NBC_01551]MCX4542442.1 ABC transporter permease [Streptomyces sp. NBC_01565]